MREQELSIGLAGDQEIETTMRRLPSRPLGTFWALTLVIVGMVGSSRAAEDRPNLLLIVADDLGYGDVGFHGRKEWTTPHLDRLRSRGASLERCYAAAPICGPSRGALLTGKYTIHSGVTKNDQDLPIEETTIAEALKPLGYRSAIFGKWQHGRPRPGGPEEIHPLDQGFDEFFGFVDAYDAIEKYPEKLWSGRETVAVNGYSDDLFTDRAVAFIDRQTADSPFFLYLPFVAPHFANAAPAEELEALGGSIREADPAKPINAQYAGMVTRLDKNVGRVLEALDRQKLTEKTLVVFVSDHGATFEWAAQGVSAALDSNRPFRGQKRTLWEGGIRVPGVVVWPGKVEPGSTIDANVSLIDLLPTFVAAAGGDLSASRLVDGANLVPVLTGRVSNLDRTLFWEWRSEGANQIATIRGDTKLIVTHGGKPELYDVARDPAERIDLAATNAKLVKQLQAELNQWLATEDPRCND